MKPGTFCESCLMPFKKDTGVRESEQYCSLCFRNGELQYKGTDLKEFQRVVYTSMRSKGMNPIKARFFTWMIRFAPRWRTVQ